MILVDSSVWIDYFNGISTWQTDLLDTYLSKVPVIIGDLILTESFKASDPIRITKQRKISLAPSHFARLADTMSPFRVPEITGAFEKPVSRYEKQ